jgi:D-arabinose 1-dehydrogenase-like Zn-dependent alcohol dehydrogenase
MKILVFGATGRVGQSFVQKSLKNGHELTVFVRNKQKINAVQSNVQIIEGDIYDGDAFDKLKKVEFDVVVNVIGADPLKPSTIFTDTTKLIMKLLQNNKDKLYVGITGTAQMPKTFFGKISISILKKTPVKNGIIDHQHAFELISGQKYAKYALVGCPYIKDGVEKKKLKKSDKFSGGFKIIYPDDVATMLLEQAEHPSNNKIVGIWY